MKLRKYIPNLDKPLQSESAHPQWLRRWQVAGVLVAMAWAVVYLALLAFSNPFPQVGALWQSLGGFCGSLGAGVDRQPDVGPGRRYDRIVALGTADELELFVQQ